MPIDDSELQLFEHRRRDRCRRLILKAGRIRHLEWHSEVDSTQNIARRWLSSEDDCTLLPALFVADRQNAGRGQGQQAWWSPPGCLMLTVAIAADQLPADTAHWPQLGPLVAVAVADCASKWLSNSASSIELKWPNDIYLDRKKVAGILIESGPRKSRCIGIGMNVCVDMSGAPQAVSGSATSLHLHMTGSNRDSVSYSEAGDLTSLSTAALLIDLADCLLRWLDKWSEGDSSWLSFWRPRCLLTGKTVNLRLGSGESMAGKCEGIDESGQLLVRRSGSDLERIASASVNSWH